MSVQGIRTVATARVSSPSPLPPHLYLHALLHNAPTLAHPPLLAAQCASSHQHCADIHVPQNGLTHFLPPCLTLSLHYSDWAGSSRGLNAFLSSPRHLPLLTARHPSTEFLISPRPGRHPVLKAKYINGREKAICVRNLSVEQVREKVELLLGNDGTKNRKVKGRKVESGKEREGVRGGWSALHGGLKMV